MHLLLIALLAQTAPGPEVLRPGRVYRQGEVAARDGDAFFALCMQRMLGVPLSVRTVRDELHDEEAEMTGVRVDTPCRALFAVAAVPDVRSGPVRNARRLPIAPHAVELALDDSQALLRQRDFGSQGGYVVEWVTGGRSQILYATPRADAKRAVVKWAGDLNGDGHIDLLLSASHDRRIETLRLLVSTGEEGTVKQIATHTSIAPPPPPPPIPPCSCSCRS